MCSPRRCSAEPGLETGRGSCRVFRNTVLIKIRTRSYRQVSTGVGVRHEQVACIVVSPAVHTAERIGLSRRHRRCLPRFKRTVPSSIRSVSYKSRLPPTPNYVQEITSRTPTVHRSRPHVWSPLDTDGKAVAPRTGPRLVHRPVVRCYTSVTPVALPRSEYVACHFIAHLPARAQLRRSASSDRLPPPYRHRNPYRIRGARHAAAAQTCPRRGNRTRRPADES